MNTNVISGIILLALGTYLIRLAGPAMSRRFSLSAQFQSVTRQTSTVLLFTVAITSTLYSGQHYAGHAQVIGVSVSALLAYKKQPFIVVVLSAAVITAFLRYLGSC